MVRVPVSLSDAEAPADVAAYLCNWFEWGILIGNARALVFLQRSAAERFGPHLCTSTARAVTWGGGSFLVYLAAIRFAMATLPYARPPTSGLPRGRHGSNACSSR